ncbi:RTA1-domain-containing protein [Macroventuria anomochaeta]|uniref:RTA1-domain-containing protein n=1 Tax=Macroventuria anomochaeta TaxID=301207 RepID=A0ACB6RJL5_9PLEO|nr:RTA1-domain-containing protein [Macroventuria anomochaeta]KAF2621293.1 RTA1-domain-containing protein [Macroventuria anomochaeta]
MLHHLYTRKDGYTDQPLYPYNPSDTAAYAFVAMFAIAGLLHLVLMFPYRAWFPIPMIIGTAMEAGSYYLRSKSHDNIHQILPFIISTLLIMGAAPMLAATIYMSLKRIVNAVDAAHSAPISMRWVSKLFVLFDVGCFISQIAGSAMRADVKTLSTGTTLVMVGLIIQVVIFFICIALMASIHFRLNRNPTNLSNLPTLSWRRNVWSLYFVSGLFLVRNFIRILEFKQGDSGWLLSSEVPLYIFDGGFMLVIVVMMAVVHPGRLARKVVKMGKEGGLEMGYRDSAKEPFRPLASQM